MRIEKIVRYEFTMSSEEFNRFKQVVNEKMYEYSYQEEYVITCNEDNFYRIKDSMEEYIGIINTRYDLYDEEITREEFITCDYMKSFLDDIFYDLD